jgi:Fe-S cluster biogenesis protein NfuA
VEPVERRIEQSLDTIRPYLRADGGDVRFLKLRPDGVLEIQWTGTCLICPMSTMTLRAGVERALLNDVPEVKRVEAVAGSPTQPAQSRSPE